MTGHADFRGMSKDGFFKTEAQVRTQILASLGARAPSSAAARAKQIAKAKDVAQIPEEIPEILKDAGIETISPAGGSGADSGVPEAIVQGALFLIRQNGVGLAALFEPLLRFRIVRITVGMVLQRQPPVGALDFLIAGRPGYAEDFVILAFVIGRQGFYASRSSFSIPAALRATRTMAGRNKRPFSRYPRCSSCIT
jgi:hypothetical protein